ncbi:MAG: nitroreductase family protein [Candidatus Woesearchaeota archaeon]
MTEKNINNIRVQEFDATPIFRSRWSPRSMSGEPLSKDELMVLFEAARWAPSSYNSQPWRFIYVLRNSTLWNSFFDLLVDFNKSWAKNAGALVLVISRKNYEHNEEFSRTHSFDTGAAWQNLALEASFKGLVCHAMGGFDHDEAKIIANVADGFNVECMVALGKPGKVEDLPESLRGGEVPSSRKRVSEFAFEGKLS